MNSTGDPSTLYAASAAAAGALVAIMGGFLISRVVGLLSQRDDLRSRRRQLDRRLQLAEEELSLIYTERLGVSVDWFDNAHLEEIIEQRGQIDIEAMTQDSNYVGTTEDEMRSVVTNRARQVRDAFTSIESAVPKGPVNDFAELGLEVPEGQEHVWIAVADAVREQRRPAGFGPLFSGSPIVLPSSGIEYRRQDQRIRDERQVRSQVAALTAEIALIDEEMSRLGNGLPRIMMSIGILGYFALGSVAFPLALLARNRVTDSPVARWAVWGLFLSGLIMLIGFLIWSAWPLRSRANRRQQ